MDEFSRESVDYAAAGEPYAGQSALVRDLLTLLDYRIYLLYKYHQWLGPANDMKNMLGLVVTREEFEHNLSKAAPAGLESRVTPEEREQIRLGERLAALRMERTDPETIPLLQLFRRFALDDFGRWCAVLALAGETDEKYAKLFSYLQDDISRKRPGLMLAVSLFMPEGGEAEEYLARFREESAFAALFDREKRQEGALALESAVLAFLTGGGLPEGFRLFDGARERPAGELVIQQDAAGALDRIFEAPGAGVILLTGREGSGRQFQTEHVCARHRVRCLTADFRVLPRTAAAAALAGTLARLWDACLCARGLEEETDGALTPPPAALLETLTRYGLYRDKLFLLLEKPLRSELQTPVLELELPDATADDRLTLFRTLLQDTALAPDVALEEVAAKFRFTPRQVYLACIQAAALARVGGTALSAAELHRCCYRQVAHKLDALASRVRPGYSWDDVVLPEEQKRLLRHACAHVRYQHRVYYDWGFDQKITYGRGVAILFAGVPGTGKTMCAQIMARQLNMEMYKINISQIVSKYIGETEKNLQAVFNEARNSNCILFFDECDALFGKRSEVKDAHDRNANVETAYLLQQIEEYDGVCVLATNLIQNIDEAFMRRMTYVVHFPFPDAKMREEIFRRTLPASAPLGEDVDLPFLAEKFQLSGGYIKNIVLAGAFMAAEEGKPIGMRHLLNAAVNEMKKNEIVVVRETLREYADLLD